MRKEGLQLEKIFDNPVPYLSRKESRDAIERLESRAQTRTIKDHPYDEDEEGLNFFSTYVFDEITSWLGDRYDDVRPTVEFMGIMANACGRAAKVRDRDPDPLFG